MPELTIGRLANLAGVRVDTVRFYERTGLLPAPSRSESGYRTYLPEHVDRLRFIRRAKELGFKLDQIGKLLRVGPEKAKSRTALSAAATAVGDLDRKIRELCAIRDVLRDRGSAASAEDLIGALLGPPELRRG